VKLTEKHIIAAAALARLQITEQDMEKYLKEVEGVLKLAQKLWDLPVDGIVPTINPADLTNILREDLAEDSLGIDEALGNAPKAAKGYFQVPKVLEE
jgi:aspartyl-tRNA(Asn)/glutamyl-tRNA(Gln) amidotransferase subunit C